MKLRKANPACMCGSEIWRDGRNLFETAACGERDLQILPDQCHFCPLRNHPRSREITDRGSRLTWLHLRRRHAIFFLTARGQLSRHCRSSHHFASRQRTPRISKFTDICCTESFLASSGTRWAYRRQQVDMLRALWMNATRPQRTTRRPANMKMNVRRPGVPSIL